MGDDYRIEKRNELMWALSLQNYSYADIGIIFNVADTTAMRVIAKKPRGWVPKWVKRT